MAKDLEMGGRIAWLRKDRGLEQKEAAAAMGMVYGTYQLYEYGNYPSRKNLSIILKYYGCDKSWLLTGSGVAYPERLHDGRPAAPPPPPPQGPPPVPLAPIQQAPCAQGQEFRISDALAMCARVLESGTSYATALYLNIQHFDRAVQAETVMQQYHNDLIAQKKLIDEQGKRLVDQERRMMELENKIRYLTDLQSGQSAGAS